VEPRVCEALVELVDVPATIEAMTGVEPRHTHFGRSLLPLVAGRPRAHRDAVFCEGGRLKGEAHCSERESASSADPAGLYWPRVALQGRIPEHSKAVMCRTRTHKYVRRLYETDELYDLTRDPGEIENRIADPAYAGVLAQMKDCLLTFFLETGDVVPHETDLRDAPRRRG
jgi:arylsulfatase A-like enzyme